MAALVSFVRAAAVAAAVTLSCLSVTWYKYARRLRRSSNGGTVGLVAVLGAGFWAEQNVAIVASAMNATKTDVRNSVMRWIRRLHEERSEAVSKQRSGQCEMVQRRRSTKAVCRGRIGYSLSLDDEMSRVCNKKKEFSEWGEATTTTTTACTPQQHFLPVSHILGDNTWYKQLHIVKGEGDATSWYLCAPRQHTWS